MDGDIRKAMGPKARLAAMEAQARRAGRDCYDDELRRHQRQFPGGSWRSYECREEADEMRGAHDVWDVWSFQHLPLMRSRVEQRVRDAFIEGWDERAEQ